MLMAPAHPERAPLNRQTEDESNNEDLTPHESLPGASFGNATAAALDSAATDQVFSTFNDAEDERYDLLGFQSDDA
jgi:hypothetical protein